jgi:hypothetical protein
MRRRRTRRKQSRYSDHTYALRVLRLVMTAFLSLVASASTWLTSPSEMVSDIVAVTFNAKSYELSPVCPRLRVGAQRRAGRRPARCNTLLCSLPGQSRLDWREDSSRIVRKCLRPDVCERTGNGGFGKEP